jgi:hypothetical protein
VRDGGSADCGAVGVMEVVWPSGVALRGEASNRPQVHWLKTVVLNVVGKGAARSRQVWVGKMSDGRNPRPLPLTCRKWSDDVKTRARPIVLGSAWGSPVYCPGGIRHIGSMIPTEALLWNA